MIEVFVKSIYGSIVEENLETYKNIYHNTVINQNTNEYWKQAIALYNGLPEEGKLIVLSIIKQTMIDTISTVLGTIDGTCTLQGFDSNLKLLIDEKDTEDLQDHFLAFVEENQEDQSICINAI